MSTCRLFADPQSPYAYLAFARAPEVLGVTPELCPIVLGPIFQRRGFGSWGVTDEREAQQAEVERRALAYGLPPVRWPDAWPAGSLRPSRALMWAHRLGAGPAFLAALYEREFARGEDPTDAAVLSAAAQAAGLDPDAVEDGLADDATKRALREATDAAWDLGVRGAPTIQVGDELFFGDDSLEVAASALSRG